jgi:hypothetical protein
MKREINTPMTILPRRDTRMLGISGRMATVLSSSGSPSEAVRTAYFS